jgi:hypothetical protein
MASLVRLYVWQSIPNQKPTENGYKTHRNGSETVSRSIETNLSSILDRIHESNALIRIDTPAGVSGANRTRIRIRYVSDTGCGGFGPNLGYIDV